MWIWRWDLLDEFMRSRQSLPFMGRATRRQPSGVGLGPPRRHPSPSWGGSTRRQPSGVGPVILTGLIIGALAGLTWIELATPGSAGAALHAVNPKTWLDARQAKLNARIPPGGFRSCDQAKAAGFGRIWAGEPAYSPWLDKDGDGKACEWNAGLFD